MALIPCFWQQDPRWKNQRLGVCNGSTIGAYGCYLTAMAQVLLHYGHGEINPAKLDDFFTAHGGYSQGCLLRDNSLSLYDPSVQLERVYNYAGITPTWAELAAALTMGPDEEVIVEVDFDHNPNDGIQTHFFRIFSFTDGQPIWIDDPWFGFRANFADHYGTNYAVTIQKVVKYRKAGFGAKAPAPVVVPAPAPVITQPDPRDIQIAADVTQVQNLKDQAAKQRATLDQIHTLSQ